MIRKILYVRNGPYKVNPNLYNLQEIGFCKVLCNKGFDCDIVYYSNENKDECIYENKGKKINLLWRKGYKILRTGVYPVLLKKSFVNKYDLIITTEYSQIMSLLWTMFKSKVVLYNGPYYNLFKIPIMEKIYDYFFVDKLNNNLHKIFTKSRLSKEYLEKKGFNNVDVLGVGLDTTVFENGVEKSEEVTRLVKFMEYNKCILYVGSLDERKNFRFILQVFEQVNKESPSTKLVIIGQGKDKYVDESFNLISKETCGDILHIKKIENRYLQFIYKKAEVFLLPSKLEIFGMVLLEAMYFGVPSVTSINGGSTTLIENKQNGIIIKEFDANKWANEILKLLQNETYRSNIGKNARNTIINNFTWEKISKKFLELI